MGALLLAVGLVLVSPAMTVGAQTDDTTPEDTTPEDTTPEDTTPEDTTPEDTTPEDTTPEDTTPEDTTPEDTTPEDTTPEDTTPEAQAKYISIEQTIDEEQGPCSEIPAMALRNYRGVVDDVFRLTVVVRDPLCSPIEATAAVYAMPGYDEAWPQTLTETLDFTLQEAGTTVVEFSLDAICSQYDVVVGETPEVIAPLGEWHGPLLFPFETGTSFQNWDGCPEVAPAVQEPNPEVEPAELAWTGSSATPFTAGGAFLLLVGAGALLAARRRVA